MRYLFDTQALMALFKNEGGAEIVKSLLQEIENGKNEGFGSVITLTEIFYLYAREDEELARKRIEQLKESKLVFIPADQEIALKAGAYKIRQMPLADSIIAATAHFAKAKLVTNDKHFREIGLDTAEFR